MSAHNQYTKLNLAEMPAAGQTLKAPAGYLLGWGATVGNSLQGWAPGSIFVDINAAQGSQVYLNTGTKTTATWTEIADAGVAGGFTLSDSSSIKFGDGNDITAAWDGTALNVLQAAVNSVIYWGINSAGIDQVWYGDTTSVNMMWDQSADSLIFNDNAKLVIGTGLDDTISHDGTNTTWTHAVGDLIIDNTDTNDQIILRVGTDTTATAIEFRNNSDVSFLTVTPESASGGTVVAMGLRSVSVTAAAITTTRTLTAADSGGTFSVAKSSAYAITLPTPAQGLRFKFLVLDTGANIVTIASGGAWLNGIVSVNSVNVVMTGTTISLASGGALGDWVMFEGIDATHYLVTGASLNAADITIA